MYVVQYKLISEVYYILTSTLNHPLAGLDIWGFGVKVNLKVD